MLSLQELDTEVQQLLSMLACSCKSIVMGKQSNLGPFISRGGLLVAFLLAHGFGSNKGVSALLLLLNGSKRK